MPINQKPLTLSDLRDLRSIWNGMWARCSDPNHIGYETYGGAGIEVCGRWCEFEWFAKDMGPRPSSKHSIDRIDNDEGYFPQNCRWATSTEQNRNRRNNRIVEFEGRPICVSALAEVVGVDDNLLRNRLSHGWTVSEAINPSGFRRVISREKRAVVAMRNVRIPLPRTAKDELKLIALKRGVSVSSVVCGILEDFVKLSGNAAPAA